MRVLASFGFDGATQTFDCGLAGAWDLAFLAIDQAHFSPLYFAALGARRRTVFLAEAACFLTGVTPRCFDIFETNVDPIWRKFLRERHEQEKNGEE